MQAPEATGVSLLRTRTCGRGVVLLRRLPGLEGGQNAMGDRRNQSNQCLAPKKQHPRRGRRDTSMERSLTEAREAHQKALAMVATLEEEIEQLSCPLTRSQSES